MAQVGPDELPTTAVAVAPDGGRIAYLAGGRPFDVGYGYTSGGYREVRVTAGPDRGRKLTALPSGSNERLVDVAWAPDGEHLLLAARRGSSDGDATSRLLWLPVGGGSPAELTSLPAEMIPASYSWSPAGDGVAFLARSGDTVALCALRTDGSAFRYLADLSRGHDRYLPYAPLSWSADGRQVVYSSPVKPTAYGEAGPQTLYTDDLSGRPSVRLGEAEGQSPAWADGGEVLALAREKAGGPLVLRALDREGATRDAGLLPLTGGAFAVRWDVAHAQALHATLEPAGFSTRGTYWLALWTEGASQ